MASSAGQGGGEEFEPPGPPPPQPTQHLPACAPTAEVGYSSCSPKAGPFAGRIWGLWGWRGSAAGKGGDPLIEQGGWRFGFPIPSHQDPGSTNTRVLDFITTSRPVGTIGDVEVKHMREHLRG